MTPATITKIREALQVARLSTDFEATRGLIDETISLLAEQESTHQAAEEALTRLEARKGEDEQQWAGQLAEDLVVAGESETPLNWQLVPRHMTEDMARAYMREIDGSLALRYRAMLAVAPAPLASTRTAPPADGEVEEMADMIVRDVCELPDRTSPDDQPEMMLVTGEELHSIVVENLRRLSPQDAVMAERARCLKIARAYANTLHNSGWKRHITQTGKAIAEAIERGTT